MFEADYKTEIILGGENCPNTRIFDLDQPSLPIVADLDLKTLPAQVTETLTPKVSVGLEPQIRNQWSIYTEKKISWASKLVCAIECDSNKCQFSTELTRVATVLEAITVERQL